MITFGKYSGKTVRDMFADPKYMRWAYSTVDRPEFRHTVDEFIRTEKSKIIDNRDVGTRFWLGSLGFKTKAAAKSMVSLWLKTSVPGYLPTPAEHEWIIPLLQMHPRWDEKSERMSTIAVDYIDSSYCFVIVRDDNTREDISYNKCLNVTADSKYSREIKAFRDAITPQIIEYKTALFCKEIQPVCVMTGVLLTWDTTHIDHDFTEREFCAIVKDFVAIAGQPPLVVSAGTRHHFSDNVYQELWCDYHRTHAILRPLDKQYHIEASRGKN